MNNFNKTRFLNFGKYDYIINKSFYRNLTLIALFGCIGITLLGFFVRWTMCHGFITANGGLTNLTAATLEQLGSLSPTNTSVTCIMLLGFTCLMMVIYAGFTFHNLRTKQGRIIELTIPATNLERWTWHVLVSFLGGLIVCMAGILCADAINEILNLIVYQGHVNSSLTAGIWNIITIVSNGSNSMVSINGAFASMDQFGMRGYFICLLICAFFCNSAIYTFGNSIKYHYNIILTYIVENILSFVLSICLMVFISFMAENVDSTTTEMDELVAVKTFFVMLTVAFALIAILCYWGSYRNYCNAQITSHLNP